MRYWNQDLDALEVPELVTASAQAYGAWSRICAYCVRLENNGTLRGAAAWTDRQWRATCRLESDDIEAASLAGLICRQGDDVRCLFYPHQAQSNVQSARLTGFHRGAVTTSAKAEAARQNGRLGGRPRTYPRSETQENPLYNPRETQRNPTGKPTASSLPSEIAPETQGKGKDNGKVSGLGLHPAASQSLPPPTDRIFNRAEPDPSTNAERGKETDAARIARLRAQHPGVDIDRELAAALIKYPTGYDLDWFETHWMPHTKTRIQVLVSPTARGVKAATNPEPEGWRDLVASSVYGPGEKSEAKTWDELPKHAQAHVLTQLAAPVKRT